MLTLGNYRITQDASNYIVQSKHKRSKDAKNNPGEEYWRDCAFYGIGQLDLALNNVLNRNIADADKQEIAHCIKAINAAKKEILEAVRAR